MVLDTIGMETVARPRRRSRNRAEQVAENRTKLLDAAGRVFRDLGYSGASLDTIAQEAGFSKGAVYSHFTSKADLFLSLLEDRISRRLERQLAAVRSPSVDGDGTGLLREVFQASRADPQWHLAVLEFRVTAARDPALNARYAEAHRRTVDGIVETLRPLYADRGMEPELPLDALAVAGLMLDAGSFLEHLAAADGISTDDVAWLFGRLAGLPTTSAPPDRAARRRPRRKAGRS